MALYLGCGTIGVEQPMTRAFGKIGISGHYDPALMMEMIRRDRQSHLEALLVMVNANGRLIHNMQYNVIPVVADKETAVITMKVFTDGAMYTKPTHWTEGPHEVVRTVGSATLPSRPLIEYALSTPSP